MIIRDEEFGEVLVRKNPRATVIKFSVSTSGRLAMSVPKYTADFLLKKYLNASRKQIRKNLPLKDPREQRARDYQKRRLMKKAREYLPYRLDFWAKKFGYLYDRCRLSHARTRWGSCSSNRTISLNIGLMQVPEVLRDYVIIHELAHLNHMDHSDAFWEEVAEHDPKYKLHREKLQMFDPGV